MGVVPQLVARGLGNFGASVSTGVARWPDAGVGVGSIYRNSLDDGSDRECSACCPWDCHASCCDDVHVASGQENATELRRAAFAALTISGVAVAMSVIVYVGAGQWIVAAFLDSNDTQAPAILSLGVALMWVAALFQLVDAAQVMALGFLRGVQDTRRPMVLAAISYWGIGIPVSLLLGFALDMGAVGIWLGLVVGLVAASTLLMVRFFRLAPAVQSEKLTVRR